jgi:hypothetical protein
MYTSETMLHNTKKFKKNIDSLCLLCNNKRRIYLALNLTANNQNFVVFVTDNGKEIGQPTTSNNYCRSASLDRRSRSIFLKGKTTDFVTFFDLI